MSATSVAPVTKAAFFEYVPVDTFCLSSDLGPSSFKVDDGACFSDSKFLHLIECNFLVGVTGLGHKS